MGADFIGAMCPMQLTREEAKQRLRRYKENHLLDLLSNSFAREFDDDGSTPYEQAIAWVDGCIDDTFDGYEYGSRETGVFYFRDIPFLITGGMSWGDDPSDIYEAMSVVQGLELTVEMAEAERQKEPWKDQ